MSCTISGAIRSDAFRGRRLVAAVMGTGAGGGLGFRARRVVASVGHSHQRDWGGSEIYTMTPAYSVAVPELRMPPHRRIGWRQTPLSARR